MRQLILLALAFGLAVLSLAEAGNIMLAEDVVGDGSLWATTDHMGNKDRIGGEGDWAYGHVVGPQGLLSLYSFEGSKGRYQVAHRTGNYSEWVNAAEMTRLDVRADFGLNNSTLDISGAGRYQDAIYSAGWYGRPVDLARKTIVGNFTINRTVTIT